MSLSDRKSRVRGSLRRLGRFMGEGLWEEDLGRYGKFQRFGLRQLRVMVVIGRSLPRGQIPLRAAAMTLATLLALAPGIVLAFSLLGAFGGLEELRAALQRFILENLVTGVREQISSFLEQYFQGARAFQGISVLFLLGGVFGLLATIEDAFNQIWGIKRGRSLSQRLTTYTTIAVLGPFFVALSLTMTASVQNAEIMIALQGWAPVGGLVNFLFGLLPACVTILGLTMLYWIMPNTRVGFFSALPSAVIAGLIWEASKWGYGLYLSSATMYRTLYGPLVAIPLLFLWIQLSWVIVLFGALLTFAREAADDFQREEGAVTASFRERLKAALCCMTEICRAHSRGETAPNVSALAQRLNIPVRLVRAAVGDLLSGSLLHEVVRHRDRGEGGLVPARDLHHLTVYGVIQTIHTAGTSSPSSEQGGGARAAEEILAQIDERLALLGKATSFADMVAALEQHQQPDHPDPVQLFTRP
ncbi:MAG: YihY family inner membrane protein [Candidatus Eisenbacteria sp.]|nr:YihY family inner membrane protein [Candidatus Eisenbacteria bacterium]